MDKNAKKPRNIIFTEEVDSAINGYAVAFLFIGIGLFLLFEPNYFAEPIASYIIGAVIGLVGVIGTGIELSKNAKIKGIDVIAIGVSLFMIWLLQYVYIHALWGNIVFFIFLVLGIYGVLLGLFRAVYSIVYNTKKRPNEEGKYPSKAEVGKLISQSILLLTQLCGLAVAIINVLKAAGLLGTR